MKVIDCSSCGSALALPDGLKEGATFACGACGLAMRNVAWAREFRWDAQDPYLRKHGVSRWNLWGGMAGSLVWVVVLAGLMVVRGKFSLGVLLAIAAPYLLLLAALRITRARRPALLWMMQVWMGLGAYLLYLSALSVLLKDWTDVMKTVADISPALLLALGAGWLAFGFVGSWMYRRYAARLVQALPAPASARGATSIS